MRRLFLIRMAATLLTVLVLAGCAGTTRLLNRYAPPPPPRTHGGRLYLAELTAAQSRLTAAEASIPHSPRTPAQLSHAIALLASAMHGLAGDLSTIRPPKPVAHLHRRLITITTAYEQRLRQLAAQARMPQREVAAANAIVDATEVASTSFTATSATIRQRLAR